MGATFIIGYALCIVDTINMSNTLYTGYIS